MAVRFECPIFTYDFILEAAGVILEEQEGGGFATVPAPAELDEEAVETWPIDALRGRLQEALDSEEYEMAAKIRDELKRREEKD
jgi:protein-arginine kinase activator protein McsA